MRPASITLLTRLCYLAGTTMLALALWRPVDLLVARATVVDFGFARDARRHTMLVLFRASDCSSHGSLITALNQLHGAGDVAVRGVLVDGDDPGARAEALAEFAPRFPLLRGVEAQAARGLARLGYRRTPSVVVVDPAGRPVLVVEPDALPWKQVERVQLAGRLVAGPLPQRRAAAHD